MNYPQPSVTVKIVVGELDAELFTNQSLIGTSLASHSEQTIMEVEFYDYLGQPLSPTKSVVLNDNREEQFNVIETSAAHKVGHYGDSDYFARWHVESNKLIAAGARSSTTSLITQIDYFALLELQTNDKRYTKFRFIQ